MTVFICKCGCESLLTEGRRLTRLLSWLLYALQMQKMEKVFYMTKIISFSDDAELWRKAKAYRLQLYHGVRIETRTVKD
jgi:uncharacterized protein YaeQ